MAQREIYQMKALILLIITPQFWLQAHYTSEDTAENVAVSDIPLALPI